MLLVSLTLALLGYLLYGLFLRSLARRKEPIFSVIIPANCSALVSKEPNTERAGEKDKGDPGVNNDGGDIVDVRHAVPGRVIDKSDQDPMNWHLKKKGKEPRGILFLIFGTQIIGLYRYLRLNDVRTFRYGRKDKESKYRVMDKADHTRYPHFSGQHDILMEHLETIVGDPGDAGTAVLRINILLNLLFEETYPVRVRLRVADPYAVLTMMATRRVMATIGGRDPRDIVSNKDSVHDKIIAAVQDISDEVEKYLGITITKTTIADIGFDDETTKLIEKEAVAIIEANAKRREAEGDRDAKIARNMGDVHRLQNVLIPAAETPERSRVFRSDREAAAYENNERVTTYAPGSGVRPVVTLDEK